MCIIISYTKCPKSGKLCKILPRRWLILLKKSWLNFLTIFMETTILLESVVLLHAESRLERAVNQFEFLSHLLMARTLNSCNIYVWVFHLNFDLSWKIQTYYRILNFSCQETPHSKIDKTDWRFFLNMKMNFCRLKLNLCYSELEGKKLSFRHGNVSTLAVLGVLRFVKSAKCSLAFQQALKSLLQ